MSESKNNVEWRTELSDKLLRLASTPKYDGGSPRVHQLDDEGTHDLRAFLEVAFENIVDELAENHETATGGLGPVSQTDYEAVSELLTEENVVDIDVASNGWASPSVRVWLSDCPRWANMATKKEFRYSAHEAHYNGNSAHAVLDVRPF